MIFFFLFMAAVLPSLLSCDILNIRNELSLLSDAGVTHVHFDVMDGHFVPNMTFGPMFLKHIKENTTLKLDVHLMVNEVERFVDWYIDAGADSVAIHIENTLHVHKVIQHIKSCDVQAGIALNPGTPLCMIEAILPFVDNVLIMSVNPGFGGQSFIEESLEKVRKLKKIISDNSYSAKISIDGGMNRTTAIKAIQAGCDNIIIGNAFFKNDYKQEFMYYSGL